MREQFFYGHGKLLITSEYLVLEGAKALCFPTNVGQTMSVKYLHSNDPTILWKSYDYTGKVWFESKFDRWKLDPIGNDSEDALILSKILKAARKQNIHFLREEFDVVIDTRLEFPIEWGLGSSSSLIYNIAQWAYVSPFELLNTAFSGSGYDIACAQSMGPILYQLIDKAPNWTESSFNPFYKDNLYFLYLNNKQSSKEEIERFQKIEFQNKEELINHASRLTDKLLKAIDLKEFEEVIFEHENLISKVIEKKKIQDLYFSDYWGAVKSLGAWGGDFALVTSNESYMKTREYFSERGFKTLLPFKELIRENNALESTNQTFNSLKNEALPLQ